MNKKDNITIRIDKDLKAKAEDLFEDLGLTISSAFTMFLKQAIREQKIPFEVRRKIPNKETMKAIKEVEEIEKGKKKTKKYNSVASFMEELNKNEVHNKKHKTV